MARSERLSAASAKLEEAVSECCRVLYEEDGDTSPMFLTQFVVLTAWAMPDDEEGHEQHKYVRLLSSDSMPMHHLAGLLHMGLVAVQEEWK